ncbi:ROK family protein, partial [Acinetobacter baumannii]
LTLADLSGLCVGLPGVIERATGICRQSPLFRERDHDFGADLQARLQLPATIDADVNLITQAEHWFGHGRGLNDFLVVS